MHQLSSSLPALQDAAEGAAPHLVDHIVDTTKRLRGRIEAAFCAQFENVLRNMQWPTPGQTLPEGHEAAFHECVRKLFNLQKPDLEAALVSQQRKTTTRESPLVLLPLQVMVKPMDLVFRYHFESDKPTNRLDRPEYFLSHVTDKLLGQYADFVADTLQPILSDVFRASDLSLNPAYGDATCAFITALLPMVRNKVFSILPRAAQKPQLLSHLIHELMSFDATLREEWNYDDGAYDGAAAGTSWRGLTYEVLATDNWFNIWLNIEKEYAIARYEKIVDAADSKDLDYDGLPPGVTKPTKAAIRVNDLLEAATDNYRTLASFSQKLRFVIDIQLAIFDRYHERLLDHLNAYQIRNTRIGRTSKEEQLALQGIQGLETLCKIYGSAEYLEKAMRDWSDDVFFLDMWTELQDRAGGSGGSRHTTVARDMTLAKVAEVTSSSLGTEDGELNGAMFDETAAAYQRLRVRCETIIMEVVGNQVRQFLQPYTRINPWASLSQEGMKDDPPPTAELDQLLKVLYQTFGFFSRAVGKLPLRKIARAAAATVDEVLFDRVLLVHSFSTAGAAQLMADIKAIRRVLSTYVETSVPDLALRHVSEGAQLVGLPIRASKASLRAGGDDDDDEDEEGEEGGRKLGLWEVEKKLFEAGGGVAKACLAELGFEKLAVHEARKVLARRIELSS